MRTAPPAFDLRHASLPARLAVLSVGAALLSVVAAAPATSLADSVPTCHCFTNRTFDPESPAAADPYILATTRSSLLSAALGPPKGTLVRSVMGGAHPDALWIAYWAGARENRPADQLLEERIARGSWKDALGGARNLGPELSSALARGAPEAELAAIAVDDVLASRLGEQRAAIRALRSGGATTEEVIAATFLARRLRSQPAPVFARVHGGKASWGMVLREAGLAPHQIDAAIRTLVR